MIMITRLSLMICLSVIVIISASCGPLSEPETSRLAFEAAMNVDSEERFHVSLGVRNLGDARFRAYDAFNGKMELRDSTGAEAGRISLATLWELAPGNAGWPAAYASKLPAGAYQLTWGAPGYGSVTVDFTIVELEGRLYLGEEVIHNEPGEASAGETMGDGSAYGPLQSLVDLARANLAQRLGVKPEAVTVQRVEETNFSDASLGVPQRDQFYAQVITPGYAIKLAVGDQAYEYRASDERLVFVPPEGQTPSGSITIEGVQVTAGEKVTVHGQTTLPDGTCLGSELWADGELQEWWPGQICVPVQGGAWQIAVRLGAGRVPADLDPSAQYMLRVYQQGGADIVAVFAFDLSAPPTAQP